MERLADWVGILNRGRLEFAEAISSLQARFRRMEVVVGGDVQLPQSMPESWLVPEKAGHTARFVESRYSEGESEQKTTTHFSGCQQVTANPMSLREIFVTLARTYQLSV